uniref:ACT domain-containing protein n=1 Tax=Steinernema glaseri TaxID=37863 RepID=A0A1I7YP13_9BILA
MIDTTIFISTFNYEVSFTTTMQNVLSRVNAVRGRVESCGTMVAFDRPMHVGKESNQDQRAVRLHPALTWQS